MVSAEAIAINAFAKSSVSDFNEARSFWTVDFRPAEVNWDFLFLTADRAVSISGMRFWTAAMIVLESPDESWDVAWASEVPCLMDFSRADSAFVTGLTSC